MGASWVAVSINNMKTRASREMTSRKNIKIFDERCQALACGGARYLPSLIALLQLLHWVLDILILFMRITLNVIFDIEFNHESDNLRGTIDDKQSYPR